MCWTPAFAKVVLGFTPFFVCCLRLVGRTRKFLAVVMCIATFGCTGNSNEPKLGWVMRQKVCLPALVEAVLPYRLFFCVCCFRPMGEVRKFLSVVMGITATGCIGSSKEPKLGQAMHQKRHRLALAEEVLPSTPFFWVCCLRLVGKARKFVSIVVGITIVGCTGSSNDPKIGRVMCQKTPLPALAEVVLPSTLFFQGVSLASCGKSKEFLSVVVGITAASCTGSNKEPKLGWAMCQNASIRTQLTISPCRHLC